MRSLPFTPQYQRPSVLLSEQGASAIEFALLAPVLLIALMGTVDVGRALTQQMALGSILRTGAQSAIAGSEVSAVNRILLAAKDDDSVLLNVVQMCACPESPQAAVACSTTCAGPGPTAIYYSLTAEKAFSGLFMPGRTLRQSLQVQIR